MTDPRGLACEQLREIGAELALGVLPAKERAEAMDHLEHCPACREYVHELVATADALLDLVPGSEPPVGFEDRVIDRLGLPSGRGPRRRVLWRRFALGAAAAAAGLALGGGGWVLGASAGRPAPVAPIVTPVQPQLLTAQLAHGGRRSLGQVYLYTGPSPWLYMTVDADGHSGTVRCELRRADGSTVQVGSFALKEGYGAWGAPYPVGAAPVTGLRLFTADGSVLAAATFGQSHH